MNTSEQLFQLGQSVWYDNIQRRLLQNGELEGMIKRREIFGVTSNPTIFNNAISKSSDYDLVLNSMAWAGYQAEDIFWELAIEDIRAAADLFKPLYDETNGGDGYVSLEVNPRLANDAEGTFNQAQEIWKRVNRENLMVKIPATKAGIIAIEKAIEAGINVNVTLIFSLSRYQEVINAYLGGLEKRLQSGKPIDRVASVASFFVSRVDSKVDSLLQSIIDKKGQGSDIASTLLGNIAISNSLLAYELFKKNFTHARFEKLVNSGGRLQRPLWASTSTKNPAYRDVIYIESLIQADTVNTVPPATLKAFLEHGKAAPLNPHVISEAEKAMENLASLGISIENVTKQLEEEGVNLFADAFDSLLSAIEAKASHARKGVKPIAKALESAIQNLESENAAKRLFDVDPSLWTNDSHGQAEIRKRCNWLTAPWTNTDILRDYETLLNYCKLEGITHALLLGMGGSSLAPEVLSLIYSTEDGSNGSGLSFAILDSTDPKQVEDTTEKFDPSRTLFIVSSKSGGTAEVNAYFDYCWEKAAAVLGKKAGAHFIAITDPGTNLAQKAQDYGFFHVYYADPNVGGRNSALTAFGLVPATLIGYDVNELLKNAIATASRCVPETLLGANPGMILGAIFGSAWKMGKDKLTIVTDQGWSSFGSWLEQLIAESSGKQGKGLVPIAQEPILPVRKYSKDRIFIYIRSNGENDQFINELMENDLPVIEFKVNSGYDLGGQFYLWEVAVAIACSIMGVNSFDQPDVQDNKTRTTNKIEDFRKTGSLQEMQAVKSITNANIFGRKEIENILDQKIVDFVISFLRQQVNKGDYIAINAYLPRNDSTFTGLTKLRQKILEEFGNATTLGFGPRFLHSTGQLHKGGANNGVFIQITANPAGDIDIPGEGITFGILERAQAIGDYEALESRGRRLIRVNLSKPDVSLLSD